MAALVEILSAVASGDRNRVGQLPNFRVRLHLSGRAISAASCQINSTFDVKGQIVSHEDLIIRGEIEGTIEIPEYSLTIASEGKVRADVNVRELEVIGSIHGNIEAAEKVYLRNGSNVVGDIQSAGILIEDGAQSATRQPIPRSLPIPSKNPISSSRKYTPGASDGRPTFA